MAKGHWKPGSLALSLLLLANCSTVSSDVKISDAEDARTAAETYLQSTSAYQAASLEDGVVTPAEYEAANLAVVACIEESGFIDADLLPGPGDLKGGVSTYWQGSDDAAEDARMFEEADSIRTECMDEYWVAIDHVYHKQQKPTESERLELLDELVSCMSQLGITGLSLTDDLMRFAAKADTYDGEHSGGNARRCLTNAEMAFFEN